MKPLRCFAALLLLACGGEPPPRPAVPRPPPRDAGVDSGSVDAGDPLAADPRSFAPGMRELLKKELEVGKEPSSIGVALSSEVDTCVRVVVRARAPIAVKLSARGGTLGEGMIIGERGPVCVRKGDALTLEIRALEGERTGVRAYVWAAP